MFSMLLNIYLIGVGASLILIMVYLFKEGAPDGGLGAIVILILVWPIIIPLFLGYLITDVFYKWLVEYFQSQLNTAIEEFK